MDDDSRTMILLVVETAARIGMGEDLPYGWVPDEWMGLLEDVIEDVRDRVREASG